jgi:hypothetical protein
VVSTQTFGDYPDRFHPHLHVLATDGCFYGQGLFRATPKLELKYLEKLFRLKVLAMLLRNLSPMSEKNAVRSRNRKPRGDPQDPGAPATLVGQCQAYSQGPFAPWPAAFTPGFLLTASGYSRTGLLPGPASAMGLLNFSGRHDASFLLSHPSVQLLDVRPGFPAFSIRPSLEPPARAQALPSDSPRPHKILGAFLLDTQSCHLLFSNRLKARSYLFCGPGPDERVGFVR